MVQRYCFPYVVVALITVPACTALLDDGFQPLADGGPVTDAASPDATVDPVVWTQVAAGEDHACGLRSDGTLWCWGDYESGQLGHGVDGADLEEGEIAIQATPVQVLSAAHDEEHDAWDDWTDVALGISHSCGIRADGTLWCWGDGAGGQLGHEEREGSPLPVLVRADEDSGELFWDDWVEVSLGQDHTCGRREDDTLWCWGRRGGAADDEASALGDGEPLGGRTTPTQVLREFGSGAWDDWVEVAVHQFHSCGRRRDGTLWCWGPNGIRGRLGTGDEEPTTTPRQVVAADGGEGWDDWVQVGATERGGCGRRRDRTAWCWGSGSFGIRGDGTVNVDSATPTQVIAADAEPGGEAWGDWIDIQGGRQHVCGQLEDGSLWCWGVSSDGRLGDGFTTEARSTPSRVLRAGEDGDGDGWDDWVQVAPGRTVTCGLRAEGSLWCWGAGEHGQRGDGDPETETRETPIRVLDPSP